MIRRRTDSEINPWFVLVIVGLGTGLSLLGDSSLYTVLPTHTADAAITLTAVGVMLSANRWIRLLTNGPVGWLCDRFLRRTIFVPALFLGGCSTLIYGLTTGYWPLLLSRLMWGISWSGIWIAGNAIVLDVSTTENRGKLVGLYNVAFFTGSATGAFLGGWLTDLWGYAAAMRFEAALTLTGAMLVLLFLPETKSFRENLSLVSTKPEAKEPESEEEKPSALRGEFGSILALIGLNRLLVAGILTPTFALLLQQTFQDQVTIFGRSIGVTTLTGFALGISSVFGIAILPLVGNWSDRLGNRWRMTTFGLLPGIIGFLLLAIAWPWTILLGLPLIKVMGSSNQGMATMLIGDISFQKSGRNLGILFTMGDLASAIGPLFVFWFVGSIDLRMIYVTAAILFGFMFVLAGWWSLHQPDRSGLATEKPQSI
ncbi:MAG: MFS family permease [Candidatus Promineifilaceae bacterium]|jgi:MFS family permease